MLKRFDSFLPIARSSLVYHFTFSLILSQHPTSFTNFVFVDEPPSTSSKKKHLTDSELALRREETARKRKDMSEKKLEDEKVRCVVFVIFGGLDRRCFFFGSIPLNCTSALAPYLPPVTFA